MRVEESSVYRRPMSDSEWLEIMAVLKTGIALLNRAAIQSLSGQLREAFSCLDPVMEGYCRITCPDCSDPCCTARNIFFNRADMLSLLALGISPPQGQTRTLPLEACRYLSPKGCRLHRAVRPYVCVWYLCEAQMELFRSESTSTQRLFVKHLQRLRLARLELESLYENLSQIEPYRE